MTTVPDALSNLIRPTFAAPEGKLFAIVDYSSIEYVVLAWLAQSETMLETFRSGQDPYKAFATSIFGVPYNEVTKAQRTFAKPAVLGGGYMLGGPGLRRYAESMGVELSEKDAKHHVDTFRATYSDVPSLWEDIARAVRETTEKGSLPRAVGGCMFYREGPFLRVELPSGRCLSYFRPKKEYIEIFGHKRLVTTFMGMEQYSRKWVRMHSHPGKWTENLVQAIARDVLADGLLNLDTVDFDIVGHVHDEILSEVLEKTAEKDLARMIEIMTRPPTWAPDLPLRADGFLVKRYRKD